jgi:glycosyltransferase (activator-dependent family)
VRVLFVTFPWKTHFFNLVPLAWALQTAGHEVRVASEPPLTDTITGAGLTAIQVGSPQTMQERGRSAKKEAIPVKRKPSGSDACLYHVGADRTERLSWELLAWLDDHALVPRAKFVNDGMIEDLVAYCRSWRPDLVLWDAVTNAGPIAATAVGAAHARVLFTLDLSRRVREDFLAVMARQPPQDRQDGMRDWYTGWLEKYGCEFSEDVVSGHFTIDQLPPSYRLEPDERAVSMRYVPYNGPAVVPPWLYEAPRAPRVLMTFGMTSRELPEENVVSVDQLQEILDSVADLDIELVLTLPADRRAEVARIPENTRVVDFVPMHAIMSSCSVVVNHGGAGSFNTALLSGVPQLLVCAAPDALSKNELIRQTDVGVAIPPEDVSAPRVREALVRLLEDPSFRAGAERIRQEILAQPSPNDLVAELEKRVAEHRGR